MNDTWKPSYVLILINDIFPDEVHLPFYVVKNKFLNFFCWDCSAHSRVPNKRGGGENNPGGLEMAHHSNIWGVGAIGEGVFGEIENSGCLS